MLIFTERINLVSILEDKPIFLALYFCTIHTMENEFEFFTEVEKYQFFLKDLFVFLEPQFLEGEAIEITEKLGSGRFLDANISPKAILPELKEVWLHFFHGNGRIPKSLNLYNIVSLLSFIAKDSWLAAIEL